MTFWLDFWGFFTPPPTQNRPNVIALGNYFEAKRHPSSVHRQAAQMLPKHKNIFGSTF
jgi:hypothetical protein